MGNCVSANSSKNAVVVNTPRINEPKRGGSVATGGKRETVSFENNKKTADNTAENTVIVSHSVSTSISSDEAHVPTVISRRGDENDSGNGNKIGGGAIHVSRVVEGEHDVESIVTIDDGECDDDGGYDRIVTIVTPQERMSDGRKRKFHSGRDGCKRNDVKSIHKNRIVDGDSHKNFGLSSASQSDCDLDGDSDKRNQTDSIQQNASVLTTHNSDVGSLTDFMSVDNTIEDVCNSMGVSFSTSLSFSSEEPQTKNSNVNLDDDDDGCDEVFDSNNRVVKNFSSEKLHTNTSSDLDGDQHTSGEKDNISMNTNESMEDLIHLCDDLSESSDETTIENTSSLDIDEDVPELDSIKAKPSDENLSLLDDIPSPEGSAGSSLIGSIHSIPESQEDRPCPSPPRRFSSMAAQPLEIPSGGLISKTSRKVETSAFTPFSTDTDVVKEDDADFKRETPILRPTVARKQKDVQMEVLVKKVSLLEKEIKSLWNVSRQQSPQRPMTKEEQMKVECCFSPNNDFSNSTESACDGANPFSKRKDEFISGMRMLSPSDFKSELESVSEEDESPLLSECNMSSPESYSTRNDSLNKNDSPLKPKSLASKLGEDPEQHSSNSSANTLATDCNTSQVDSFTSDTSSVRLVEVSQKQQLCEQRSDTTSPGSKSYRPLIGGYASSAYETMKDLHYSSSEEVFPEFSTPKNIDSSLLLSTPSTTSNSRSEKSEIPSGSSGVKSSDDLLSDLVSLSSTFSDLNSPNMSNLSSSHLQRAEDHLAKFNNNTKLKVAIDYELRQSTSPLDMQQSTSPLESPRPSKLERPSMKSLCLYGQKKIPVINSNTSPQFKSPQNEYLSPPRKSHIPILHKAQASYIESSSSNNTNVKSPERISFIPKFSSPSPGKWRSPYRGSRRVSRIPAMKP